MGRGFQAAGRAFFGASVAISLYSGLQNPTPGNLAHQGANIGAGYVAFLGPYGLALSGAYFSVELTLGWENVSLQPMFEANAIHQRVTGESLFDPSW